MVILASVYSDDPNVFHSHCRYLYKLLGERKPNQSISHKKMPTYANHEKFVLLKPYKEWFIIYDEIMKVGSIYISKMDEIGLFISDEHQNKGHGGEALRTILKEYKDSVFRANINPNNHKSINFFKKHGFLWQTIEEVEGQSTYIKL